LTHPCVSVGPKSALFVAESGGFAVEIGGQIDVVAKNHSITMAYAQRTPGA
jgi:hypothetical protein